jgi:hypothetical protein
MLQSLDPHLDSKYINAKWAIYPKLIATFYEHTEPAHDAHLVTTLEKLLNAQALGTDARCDFLTDDLPKLIEGIE